MRGLEIIPAAEAMLQMCPSLRSSMPGRACSVRYIGAVALTAIVRSISSGVWRSKVLLPVMMPAQLMRISTGPHSAVVRAKVSSTCRRSETSAR